MLPLCMLLPFNSHIYALGIPAQANTFLKKLSQVVDDSGGFGFFECELQRLQEVLKKDAPSERLSQITAFHC